MTARANILSWSAKNFGRTQEEILRTLEAKLREAASLSPDLICFPEEVLISSGDKQNPRWAENNAAALSLLRDGAARLRTNIVCCLEEPSETYPGKRYNTAYVIGRSGEVLGKYRKRHITFRAIGRDGLPGERIVTVDTDIGRIGLMICFDVGWREDWRMLEEAGARLVVWPSAYNGGFLLNAYAAVHMYYIVTSVWNYSSRIINAFGETVAESSHWDTLAMASVNLGGEIFHFDHHERVIPLIREKYGSRVSLRVKPGDNIFELASEDDGLSLEELKREFGLTNYREYHAACGEDNRKILTEYPEM